MDYRIQAMIDQMGGRGLRGAFVYCGASQIGYKAECAGTPDASTFTEDGFVKYQVGLTFKVNGKRSQTWKMIVSYEPSDTYTVRLIKVHGTGTFVETGVASVLLAEAAECVYADELQRVVEELYDSAIRRFNDGFINI